MSFSSSSYLRACALTYAPDYITGFFDSQLHLPGFPCKTNIVYSLFKNPHASKYTDYGYYLNKSNISSAYLEFSFTIPSFTAQNHTQLT